MSESIRAVFGIDTGPATTALAGLKGQIDRAKESFKFEGLKNERSIERSFGGLSRELAKASDAGEALNIIAERTHGIFRSGLGLGIATAAGTALKDAIDKSTKAFDALLTEQEQLSKDTTLKKTSGDIEAMSKKYEELAAKVLTDWPASTLERNEEIQPTRGIGHSDHYD